MDEKPRFINRILSPAYEFQVTMSGRVVCSSDWEVGPRIIDDHLIYFLESGGFELNVGKDIVLLKPDQLFWIQPVVKHYFYIAKGVSQAVVYFLRFNIRKHDPLRLKEDYFVFEKDPSLKMVMSELVFYEDPAGAYAGPFMRAQLGRLFCMLFNQDKTEEGQPGGLRPGQKKTVTSFIRSRLHKRFSIKELADSLNLNPDYFGRQFKTAFKMTPQEWIKQERIRMAKSLLLESRLNITEIAYRLGYEDVYFFSRQFKAVAGVSPKKWREKQ